MDAETRERLNRAFMPEAAKRMTEFRERNGRFVHYTSAEGGMAILRSGRMLLRNSVLMNDFSEVQHGMNCLVAAYNGPLGERLKALMVSVDEALPQAFEASFNE